MIVIKKWKDDTEWFEVSLKHCLNRIVNENLTKDLAIEGLQNGATFQSFNALYKIKEVYKNETFNT